MRVCSVDVGTTGIKVMIFDQDGRQLAAGSQETPVICPREGWAEQDGDLVFRRIVMLLGECITGGEVWELDALVLSVQGDAVIPVNEKGDALCPALLGMDCRSEVQSEWCEGELGAFQLFEKTGMRPHPVNSATKIMWIQQERAGIAGKTVKYLTYDGYIFKRLGADGYVTDITMASRSMMCGLDSGQWSDEVLEELGIEAGLLPDIVPSGAMVGKMSRGLAETLHLKNRPYLVTGGHDQTCAGVGAGAVVPGVVVDSHGTAEVLSTGFWQRPSGRGMYDNFFPCYRHGVKGQYFTFALNHCGGIAFRWFRDQFSGEEQALAQAEGRNAYDVMVDGMEEAPSRLLFLPYLGGRGTPCCDGRSRGTVMGLTLSTGRAETGKALLEGLSYEMRLNVQRFREIGIPVEDIRCVGGGASHSRTLQLKADVLGQPVSAMANREAASLGAAVIALSGLGYFKSVEEGVGCLVKKGKTYNPRREYSDIYSRRFELYCRAGYELGPLYKDWNEEMGWKG